MIRINGVEVVEPSQFSLDYEEITDPNSSIRSLDGTYSKDIVATKRKLKMSWDALLWSEVAEIMTNVSQSFFEVTYPDSISGEMETRTFFIESRSTPVAFMQEDENGINTYYWQGVSITMTER